MSKQLTTLDGNEAAAYVAYRVSEVIAIYPITPASPMGEWADAWASEGKPNLWGTVPSVVEMQSEGGAAGAIHGSLQAGALSTTFTASQGLLLMLPNMYKIAGELTPAVFHIAARSIAAHALSIFGDHSDVMAARTTGYAMLCSGNMQEVMDMALIAHAATLESRIPFLHFFDGFRTSHEIGELEVLPDDSMRAMIPDDLVKQHRARALSSDHPIVRGTAQNPDVFFQARETVNKYYDACPDAVQKCMDKFAGLVGRKYHLFDYHGHPQAEQVIIIMGSGAEAVHETVDYLNEHGEKVGVVKVRLYRPFDVKRFLEALPATTRAIAVLDRTKEPGGPGEPMYLDVITAFYEGMAKYGQVKKLPTIVGGRYGLSSKEFNPAMVKGVFENLKLQTPKNHFTIGINDDVTHTSLQYDPEFTVESEDVVRALFFGLGSDGTVGANKNTIKIIGDYTENHVHAYFVYDSKKAGAVTVSHLRFAEKPMRSTYLITKASFVACHQHFFLERFDMLKNIETGGTFLLNTAYGPEEIWGNLPRKVQQQIIDKKLKFYVVDAYKVAEDSGMPKRINVVNQICFFAISKVLPRDKAIEAVKDSIRKTFAKRGPEVVEKNLLAVDHTLEHLYEVKIPQVADGALEMRAPVADEAPEFVKDVLGPIMDRRGDDVPVSAFPCDGTFPSGTSKWEKRNLALTIPVWDPEVCIQCGKCTMVCPHAVIRIKVYDQKYLEKAPASFKSCDAKDKEWQGLKYTIQVAPEDCTGCEVCASVCPAKSKTASGHKAINMQPQPPLREQERVNWEFFCGIPDLDRRRINVGKVRQQQVQQPLFEFSGCCAGCGETPYLKLATQLFGDRMVVANATGCSSIYGGNLPTTPWTHNAQNYGPAWSNSLFEDNAEFGLGMRVSIDKQTEFAKELLRKLESTVGTELVNGILGASQKDEAGIYEQRERVKALKEKLNGNSSPDAAQLLSLADVLIKKDVWIIGGDGWAYDIGYGGLDHVLASGRNVNILVIDSEVYSNTGGQMSKATPLAAVAKFAAGGKRSPKKDLGLMAMSYGSVYVASVAMGAKDEQTLKAFIEAEAYDGPSLIIAYSHCIAHGIDMTNPMENQKAAVQSGQWILYRYNPELAKEGKSPLILDSAIPKLPVKEYLEKEGRFNMLMQSNPDVAKQLFAQAQKDIQLRFQLYQYMANYKPSTT